jgi:hypothetical protein
VGHQLDEAKYREAFKGKEKEALEHALETRKFEIELYWKRATYFWTFIAAALAAYGLIRASKDIGASEKTHLSVLVSVLGFVFSFAWQAVNRGSKHWQENWENHVAILEDEVIGPLYKTVSGRPRSPNVSEWIADLLTGPRNYSVSKINQLVSFFVTSIWLLLMWNALPPFDTSVGFEGVDWFLVVVIALGALAFGAMYSRFGRSHNHDHVFEVRRYTSQIVEHGAINPPSEAPSDLNTLPAGAKREH